MIDCRAAAMRVGEQGALYHDVSEAEARRELDRLLSDPRFHGTDRAKNILRYVAEKGFEGETEGVKAYAIALDVLNRTSRFDANADPIVRIEVSRLRGALTNYYEAFGAELDISIHLPIGRYVAVFSRCPGHPVSAGPAVIDTGRHSHLAEDAGPLPGPSAHQQWNPFHVVAVGTAVLLVLAAGAAGVVFFMTAPEMTVRPAVTIAMSSADETRSAEAAMTRDYLVTAISRFRTLSISSQTAVQTGSLSQSLRPVPGSAYVIDMKYYADADDRTVWWQIVDAHGGGVLKSGIEKVPVDGRSEAAVRDAMVSVLAKRFASTRGVINNLETHDDESRNALGNGCVLKAEYELDEGGRTGIRASAKCLEQTVASLPNNSDALAVLSRVLVAAEGADPATTPFDRALSLANHAVSLDPSSDRAHVALMMAQFYRGSTDAAIAAGNRALSLNPNNPEVLSKLAGVLYSSGYQSAAVSLAEDATRNVDSVPRDARIVLALDAYGRGDYSNASLIAEQVNCSDFVVRAIRAAALGQLLSPDAPARLAYLKTMLPDYQTSLRTWMERRRYPTSVIASIERGLTKASRIVASDKVAEVANSTIH
jgi:tetratricopeptide (TPR) repeat protein